MPEYVKLLEKIGADADLVSADEARLREVIESAGLGPAFLAALLQGDVRSLRDLLGAPQTACCLIDPAEEEDEEEGGEDGEDGEDENDEGEPSPMRKPEPGGSPA
jgi:hypothetical protein